MDDARLTSISLAARGFGGGNPETILGMSVDVVMDLVAFVGFERDWAQTKAELNRQEK